MFTPTIVLVWQGVNHARVVFMPASVCERLSLSKLHLYTLTSGNFPAVRTFQDFVNVFVECDDDDDNNVDLVFDELATVPGCIEDYVEFVYGARVLPEVPKGMAIVQWHFRTDDN
jgi:hypothetical protein